MFEKLFKTAGFPLNTRNFIVDYVDGSGTYYHKPMQSIMHITDTDTEAVESIRRAVKTQDNASVCSIIEVGEKYSLEDMIKYQDQPGRFPGYKVLYLDPALAFCH